MSPSATFLNLTMNNQMNQSTNHGKNIIKSSDNTPSLFINMRKNSTNILNSGGLGITAGKSFMNFENSNPRNPPRFLDKVSSTSGRNTFIKDDGMMMMSVDNDEIE